MAETLGATGGGWGPAFPPPRAQFTAPADAPATPTPDAGWQWNFTRGFIILAVTLGLAILSIYAVWWVGRQIYRHYAAPPGSDTALSRMCNRWGDALNADPARRARLETALDNLVREGQVLGGDGDTFDTPADWTAAVENVAAAAHRAAATAGRDEAANERIAQIATGHALNIQRLPHRISFVAPVTLWDIAATATSVAAESNQKQQERIREQRKAGDLGMADAVAASLRTHERHNNSSENVHDPAVVDEFERVKARLVQLHGTPARQSAERSREWARQVIHDTFGPRGSEPDPAQLVAGMTAVNKLRDEHATYGSPLSELDCLALVRARAEAPENARTAANIRENLAKGLASCQKPNGDIVCKTGRTDRVLGALTLNDAVLDSEGVGQPVLAEQLRNDAMDAAREAADAHARKLAAEPGPLRAAALNYTDPVGHPDDPDESVAAQLRAALTHAALAGAEKHGVSKMREPDRARTRNDIEAAFSLI